MRIMKNIKELAEELAEMIKDGNLNEDFFFKLGILIKLIRELEIKEA